MDMVTSNQLGKITNAQFEELQTQITQVILENEIQEILQERELQDLPEGHDCQNKSGRQAEKKIGHNCDSRKTTTITTEFLSIIQRTQPKPSDTASSEQPQ
ncbi:hypothetical protein G9A89_015953 [Geosiphon pyriformis]|nr:hypothetical protein G9A89_015953 [Geosiphon pyriformis]